MRKNRHLILALLAGAALLGALLMLSISRILSSSWERELFIAGLLLVFADAVLVFVAFICPLLSVQRFIMIVDSDSKRRQQMLSGHVHNGLTHYILRLVNTVNQQKEQEYSLEILKKQAELDALQSQINPHFLYNTLDSIRGQLLGVNLDSAADIIEALSNLFRYSINSKTVYNTLEQELENIRNYMRIITYRFGERIHFRDRIDDTCNCILNCEMPKLTLQPIVENAIEHGLEARGRDGQITIRAFVSAQGLHIEVSDNGSGMPSEILDELNRKFREGAPVQRAKGTGIGLVNVNERIRLLYGGDYGLHIDSAEGLGTDVHILLPVQLTPAGRGLKG